jgi:hypothetical protein
VHPDRHLRPGLEDRATCPSIPAVRRPALRCVTCRTLISVFDQDRSIIFCNDRACAQSCSRVALKILRRSLRTLPSWVSQSMASQSSPPSGPFTSSVSNMSLSSEGLLSISVQRLTCPRQPAFAAGHPARYPASYPARPLEGAAITSRFPAVFRHAGVRFLGILFPPTGISSPYGRPSRTASGP